MKIIISTKLLLAAGLFGTVSSNAAGRKFIKLFGDTFQIKDDLKNLGFRYFAPEKSWSAALDIIQSDKIKLQSLNTLLTSKGVNISQIMSHSQPVAPASSAKEDVVHNVRKQIGIVQKTLSQMSNALKDASQKVDADSKVKTINFSSFIDQQLNKLISNVDAQSAKQIYKSFIKFASRFHKYSFQNQMLIWIQNPQATNVAGADVWLKKFGRQVSDFSRPITILAPMPYYKQNQKGQKQKKMWFGPVKVYDVSATTTVAGWKDKQGNGSFQPLDLDITKNNQTDQHMQQIQNALLTFAKSKGLQITNAQMKNNHGGSSYGGRIQINDKLSGIQRLSTMIHQIAHQALHWMIIQKLSGKDTVGLDAMHNSKQRQIDAESTAAIVLSYFGYEPPKASAYLTLWGAKGPQIRARRQLISKAAHFIINGILSTMGKITHQEQNMQSQQMGQQKPVVASNWYGQYKQAKIPKSQLQHYNPFAVCNKSVGTQKTQKRQRCIHDVKRENKQSHESKDMDGGLSPAEKAQNKQFGMQIYPQHKDKQKCMDGCSSGQSMTPRMYAFRQKFLEKLKSSFKN